MKKQPKEMDKLQTAAELNFIKRNRVNFSKQADEIVDKIKKGIRPTSTDYFILLNTNQEEIDKLIKFDEITNRMNSGRLSHEDVDYLIDMMDLKGDFGKVLRNAMHKKADQANFEYAKEHEDEFTLEEIQSMRNKSAKLNIKDSLQADLEQMLSN